MESSVSVRRLTRMASQDLTADMSKVVMKMCQSNTGELYQCRGSAIVPLGSTLMGTIEYQAPEDCVFASFGGTDKAYFRLVPKSYCRTSKLVFYPKKTQKSISTIDLVFFQCGKIATAPFDIVCLDTIVSVQQNFTTCGVNMIKNVVQITCTPEVFQKLTETYTPSSVIASAADSSTHNDLFHSKTPLQLSADAPLPAKEVVADHATPVPPEQCPVATFEMSEEDGDIFCLRPSSPKLSMALVAFYFGIDSKLREGDLLHLHDCPWHTPGKSQWTICRVLRAPTADYHALVLQKLAVIPVPQSEESHVYSFTARP